MKTAQMMILAYIFIGLLSSTSGQTIVISLSNNYVKKTGTVTIICAVVDDVIHDTVEIYKDGITALTCPSPPVPCFGNDAAYSAVQDKTAGTTTMTISATNISRDTGNWTCQHGSTSSKAASLTIGTPVSITKMNELNTIAVIETNCTFPYAGVHVSCSVGGTDINCLHNISSYATCSDLNERVLVIIIYLDLFKGSASGLLTVGIDNGFTAVPKTGNHNYTFTATTTTHVTTDDCALESYWELGLGLGLGNVVICVFCLHCIVKLVNRETNDHKLCAKKFGCCYIIIFVAVIVSIVTLVTISKPYALKLELGLGLGIPFVGCIIVIKILVKKVFNNKYIRNKRMNSKSLER